MKARTTRDLYAASALAAAIAGPALLGTPAHAQEAEEAQASTPLDARADIGLAVAGKIGGGIGAPMSDFGATPLFELELEYLLPLGAPVGRSLGVFLGAQYAQPGLDGQAEQDPRLPGDGVLSYELTQRQLALTLGAHYRFDVSSQLVMPYAGLGGRMYLLRSEVKGEVDGVAYGENEETKTGFGMVLLGGVELYLGPGALLGELQLGWGPLDTYVLRDTNVGALSLAVGYRIVS